MKGRTPGYLVREELQQDKLRGIAKQRAWIFKKRLEEGRGSDITKRCLEERRGRRGRVTSKWEEERRDFFANKGLEVGEVERLRDRNNR